MEFFIEYGLFLAKTVTLVICFVIVISMIAAARQHKSGTGKLRGHVEVTPLNERIRDVTNTLKHAVLDELEYKEDEKAEKKREKAERSELKKSLKQKKSEESPSASEGSTTDETPARKKRVYVLYFDGDISASATEHLREEISAVLTVAQSCDEIVLCLDSSGGMVHSYGFAASQLQRIKNKGIPLTICVDKVAASGGYMMACVADKILAAPFAIIGSIGVVGQMPNFNRLMKKLDVDYEMHTAGEYKRTLTMLGENTDKDREKFSEDLEEIHVLFKDFIRQNRAVLDVEKVATGEIWYGTRAQDMQLIDGIQTSDEYIHSHYPEADLFQVEYLQKRSLQERIGVGASTVIDRVLVRWWQRLHNGRFFS